MIYTNNGQIKVFKEMTNFDRFYKEYAKQRKAKHSKAKLDNADTQPAVLFTTVVGGAGEGLAVGDLEIGASEIRMVGMIDVGDRLGATVVGDFVGKMVASSVCFGVSQRSPS